MFIPRKCKTRYAGFSVIGENYFWVYDTHEKRCSPREIAKRNDMRTRAYVGEENLGFGYSRLLLVEIEKRTRCNDEEKFLKMQTNPMRNKAEGVIRVASGKNKPNNASSFYEKIEKHYCYKF